MTIDNKTLTEALTAIATDEGELTPDAVVRAAKSPRHPLHSSFEWDDSKAAHEHRLYQARKLIAMARLVVVLSGDKLVQRIAFVRDPEVAQRQQGYRATAALSDHADQAREAVLSEIQRAITSLIRARDVAAAVGVDLDILSIIEHTEELAASLARVRKRRSA